MKIIFISYLAIVFLNLYYTYHLARMVQAMVVLKMRFSMAFSRILKNSYFIKAILMGFVPIAHIINFYEIFMNFHSNTEIDIIANRIVEKYK